MLSNKNQNRGLASRNLIWEEVLQVAATSCRMGDHPCLPDLATHTRVAN